MYSKELTVFYICQWLASSTAALINTEDLLVRNVFLDLLTVTFVVEADDILGILLFNSNTRLRADELSRRAMSEDEIFGSYWWPRALVFLPVAFSIILIFLKDDIVNVAFPEGNESCAVMIRSSTLLMQVSVPFFACLFDFSVSQWLKNDVSTSLKEWLIVATEFVPCVIYSMSLANFLPSIGISFYQKSAIAYFQTSVDINPLNTLLPFIPAVFVYIIDFFLKRLNSSTNQKGDNFLGNILRISMWFALFIFTPLIIVLFFSQRM